MFRDRLAMQAQRRSEPDPSYPSEGNIGAGNASSGRHPNAGEHYEMTNVDHDNNIPANGATGDDMTAFYFEISSIQDSLRTYNDNVSRISDLHSRSLSSMDEAAAQRNANQLDGLVAETSSLSNELKIRVKNLQKKQGKDERSRQIYKEQTGLIKQRFVEAIQNYQQVEQQYRSKYKQRMERRFKIVKPDATPEEIRAIVDDDQGGQVFTQALQSSTSYGESRAAYHEVQERHEDVKRIERTLGELAQLFSDMSVLVEQQDDTIDTVQAAAANAEKDTETGLKHTDKAVVSARSARRKRWICFIIILIILAIVAIVLGVHFGIPNGTSGGKTN